VAFESSVPYRAGSEGDASFRSPAAVRARSGALIAFAQARASAAADSDDIDVVRKHSTDDCRTWRPLRVVAVSGLPAAYSDLVRIDAASVGLRYETGDFSAYSTITFRRIPVEEPA
jgi:hypothetical protein